MEHSPMQRDRVTIVYGIKDNAAFDALEWPRIHGMFLPDDNRPFSITAISADDELHRRELIDEALDRFGETAEAAEIIREILQCADLAKWSWPKQ